MVRLFMETFNVQTFPSEVECDPSLDKNFRRHTRFLKADFVTRIITIFKGLYRTTKANELSENRGKRSCSPSQKTAKRTKLTSHISFPSEELNSKIFTGDNCCGDHSDDSNSSFKTAASDSESDISFCSASDIFVSITNSLDDEINTETELESFGSSSLSSDQILEEGYRCTHSNNALNSDILHSNEDLSCEMKPFTQRSNMVLVTSDIQFTNSLANNLVKYNGKNCSENEGKFRSIVKNSSCKNCPENQEKTQLYFERLNDADYFQFRPKKFQAVGGRISSSPEKKLNSKHSDGLLISALSPEFPACSNSQYISLTPPLNQTQNDSPRKKPYCITKNEVKSKGENIADLCFIKGQQIGLDRKLDGADFTSFHTWEIGDYIEEHSRPMRAFGSPDSTETEVKKGDVTVNAGLSTMLSGDFVRLISSETKKDSDDGESYRLNHCLLGDEYQLGKQNISEILKSFRKVTESEVNGYKFVKTVSKNNFKDDNFHSGMSENETNEELDEVYSASSKRGKGYNAGSENPIRKNMKVLQNCFKDGDFLSEASGNKTTEELDKVYLAASKRKERHIADNENHIRKKMKILQEMTGDVDSTLGKTDNYAFKRFEFHYLNPSMNMQNCSENLISRKTSFYVNGDLARLSSYCSETIVNGPLLDSATFARTVVNPSASNAVQSPDSLKEKQEIINPKSELPVKLVPALNVTEITPSYFPDYKNDVNSDEKKEGLINEKGRKKKKCQKSSKSSQKSNSENFGTWQVKQMDINATLHAESKIVPPLIIQRQKRILDTVSESFQSLSKMVDMNEKCMDQSNQVRETDSKIVPNLHNNSSKNTPEDETKPLNRSILAFTSPPKDNVKRVFEVLDPRNCFAPLVRARDQPQPIHSPSTYKIGARRKTIGEEVNSAIQLISLLLKDNHSESKISNKGGNPNEFCTKWKYPVRCLEKKSHAKKSEAGLITEPDNFPVETDVSFSCLEEESHLEKSTRGLKTERDNFRVEPGEVSGSCLEESRLEKSKEGLETEHDSIPVEPYVVSGSCMEEKFRLEKSKAGLKTELSDVEPDMVSGSSLEEEFPLKKNEAGLRRKSKDSLLEPPVARASAARKSKKKAMLLLKEILPKKQVRGTRKHMK